MENHEMEILLLLPTQPDELIMMIFPVRNHLILGRSLVDGFNARIFKPS